VSPLDEDREMKAAYKWVRKFMAAEDGPTATEYAVMLALIITVCITTISTLGINTNKVCNTVCTLVWGSSSS
jgi:pilus assembly protein Flp/PilA